MSDAPIAETPKPRRTGRPAFPAIARDDRHPSATGRSSSGRSGSFRLLRIALPTFAAIVLLLSLFWSQLVPPDSRIGVDTAMVESKDGKPEEAVVNATYSGVDHNGRPFSITAGQVRSPAGDGNSVQLTRPDAEITLQDGTRLTIAADNGIYFRDRDTLDLRGDVTLRRGSDLTVRTPSATIELRSSAAFGKQAVEGTSSFGAISGPGFRIEDGGDTVFVTGPAQMLINPEAKPMLR